MGVLQKAANIRFVLKLRLPYDMPRRFRWYGQHGLLGLYWHRRCRSHGTLSSYRVHPAYVVLPKVLRSVPVSVSEQALESEPVLGPEQALEPVLEREQALELVPHHRRRLQVMELR